MESNPGSAGLRHARIVGVGGYRPRRVVGNREMAELIGRSQEWIESRSGITSRRFAEPDETLASMGSAAAEKALAAAGVAARDIGCVILATTTNLVSLPPVSVQVAHAIGATSAGTFDLSAACAGFCYGVATASNMIRAGTADHVLVVGTERLTDLVDPRDPQIAFLLADGAGAVVLGPAEQPGVGPVVWGADSRELDAVVMTRSWADLRQDPSLPHPVMRMHGKPIFRWMAAELAPLARKALAAADVPIDQLAALIPHQANLRITELLAAQLELPDTVQVARDIVDAGNTSSASIPLAMERLQATGAVRRGEPALLIGFGAGLTFAAMVVSLP
jgi:3-oxoacyl-(acyl-carrier-protein) synthase III